MMDWYLGQAGFGEQLQRYGDAYWRQMGGALLWAFIVIWSILVLVAILVALARRADVNEQDVNEQAGGDRVFDRMLAVTHTGPLVPRARTRHPAPRSVERPDEKAVPPKVA